LIYQAPAQRLVKALEILSDIKGIRYGVANRPDVVRHPPGEEDHNAYEASDEKENGKKSDG